MFVNTSFVSHKVETLSRSEHQFYLTGSRFWGTAGAGSDWDFFVQDSLAVRDFLQQEGFTNHSNHSSYASDQQCLAVYVWHPESFDQVHVQVVENVLVKEQVQNLLFELYPNGFKDKSTAQAFWTLAFRAFKLGVAFKGLEDAPE